MLCASTKMSVIVWGHCSPSFLFEGIGEAFCCANGAGRPQKTRRGVALGGVGWLPGEYVHRLVQGAAHLVPALLNERLRAWRAGCVDFFSCACCCEEFPVCSAGWDVCKWVCSAHMEDCSLVCFRLFFGPPPAPQSLGLSCYLK